MRRRRIPKNPAKPPAKVIEPAPEPVVEPVEPVDPRLTATYHVHNPMRDNGDMPHEYEDDGFIEFLILNGMSEDIYWINVEAGEQQAIDIEQNGMPIPTDRLTPDQKGWAKADHYDHFTKETARWRPIPGKDSKVRPWRGAPRLRDRLYRNQCDDGENAKLVLWGYRWDMRELHQCQVCGEVIVRTPFTNKSTDNGDIKENHDQDDDAVAAESDHAAG